MRLLHDVLAVGSVGICLLGCSSDTTSPSGQPNGGPLPGTWIFNISPAVQSTSSCRFPSLILNLSNASESAVTGTYSTTAAVACLVNGQVYAGSLGSGTLVGILNGDSLSLTLNPIGLQLVGVRDPAGAHGLSQWEVEFVGANLGVVTVGASWRATRLADPGVLPGPTFVELAPFLPSVPQEDSVQATPTVLDASGRPLSGDSVQLSVGDTSVAVVSPAEWIHAKDPIGPFLILEQVAGLTFQGVGVIVPRPRTIVFSRPGVVLGPGRRTSVRAIAEDSAGDTLVYAAPAFSSRDSTVVRVTQTGTIIAGSAPGRTEILAVSGRVQDSIEVSVVSVPSVVATTHIGTAPYAAAVGRDGTIVVVDIVTGVLAQGALPAYTLTAKAAPGGALQSVALDSAAGRAFVAPMRSGYVGVIDLATGSLSDSVGAPAAFGFADAVALTPDGSKLLVGGGYGLGVYDARTLAFIDSVPDVAAVRAFAFHPSLALGYAVTDAGRVEEFDLTSLRLTRHLQPAGTGDALVSPDGARLYVADPDYGVHAFDLASGRLVDTIPLPGAFGIARFARSGYLLVTVADSAVLIDPGTSSVVASYPLGGTARRPAVDSSGATVVIPNSDGWVNFIQ